jgi:hypothetical protein
MLFHNQVKPPIPEAQKLAVAILELLQAEKDLKQAIKNAPSYTGDLDRRDYFADEKEGWNRAADELYLILKGKDGN